MTKLSDTQRLATHFNVDDPLRLLVVTLSDRAHAGEYEDKGGPRVRQLIDAFLGDHHIVHATDTVVLPDDANRLERILTGARDRGTHLVITTGGTGVGPRDITPDVVLKLADKTIPGVMELIRVKYGADKPCALLSRTVAAILGRTLVYTLPGSVKGVDEYLGELFHTLPHTLCVMHGLEQH